MPRLQALDDPLAGRHPTYIIDRVRAKKVLSL